MINISERPGVYSDLETSGVVSRGGGKKAVGLLAVCADGTSGLYTVGSVAAANSLFGEGEKGAELCGIALANGAAAVICSICTDSSELAAAAARFETNENAYVLICDSADGTVQGALLAAALSASAQRREKIAVFGMNQASVGQLTARAAVLNSQRAVLVGASGDGVALAAAAAGAICAQSDPSAPLIDIDLEGASESGFYSDSDFDALVLGGVSPVEAMGGAVRMSRAVTTRTTTGGIADASFRELNTILIADEVIPGIRSALKNGFYRAKNTAKTRDAIRTRVILELEDRMEREMIENYGEVTTAADADDPTMCLVAFDFTVAHGLSRVHLSAVISV